MIDLNFPLSICQYVYVLIRGTACLNPLEVKRYVSIDSSKLFLLLVLLPVQITSPV